MAEGHDFSRAASIAESVHAPIRRNHLRAELSCMIVVVDWYQGIRLQPSRYFDSTADSAPIGRSCRTAEQQCSAPR